jgi:hypothetical protein
VLTKLIVLIYSYTHAVRGLLNWREKMKPQITIGIKPAPLGEVMTPDFEREQRRLLALHAAAPELLEALKLSVSAVKPTRRTELRQAELIEITEWPEWVDAARAVIAKAEGK